MIAYVFKRKGARLFSARIRLNHERKISQVELGCSNRQVAEKRLREMVDERQREADGIVAPKAQREAAHTALSQHLAEMVESKEKAKDGHYLSNLKNRVLRLIVACGWKLPKDVTPESFQDWMSRQTLSAKSLNEYLISARTLLNWMEKRGRIIANPLKPLDLLPADDEKRRPRRAFTDEEFEKLLATSGERYAAYLLAATTGLRWSELLGVQRQDIQLDGPEPKVVARAATTKNGKDAPQPLHAEVVIHLRAFLATQEFGPTDKVFAAMFRKRGQFKLDVAVAGIARHDAENRIADFHSLRHTFCTNLQRLGTPQRVLMHLMRHSDRRLSDHLYTDTSLLPSAETVAKLMVPLKTLSQIPSQTLVPAGQTESRAVTSAESVECPAMPINTSFPHSRTFPVTPSHKGGMVRDAGFEPATSCV